MEDENKGGPRPPRKEAWGVIASSKLVSKIIPSVGTVQIQHGYGYIYIIY